MYFNDLLNRLSLKIEADQRNLPVLEEYKGQLSDKSSVAWTKFVYSISGERVECDFLLAKLEFRKIDGPLLLEAPIPKPAEPNHKLIQVLKKILSVIAYPFILIYSCFNHLILSQRARYEEFLDKVIAHYVEPKPKGSDPSKKFYNEMNALFRSKLSLYRWPIRTVELDCKLALAEAFVRIDYSQFDLAMDLFKKVLAQSTNDTFKIYAYGGLHYVYSVLVNRSTNTHMRPRYLREIDKCKKELNQLSQFPEGIQIQKTLLEELKGSGFSDVFEAYSTEHNAEKIKFLNDIKFPDFGSMNNGLVDIWFPEAKAFYYNLLAHMSLVNQVWPNSDSLDVESRILSSRHRLKIALANTQTDSNQLSQIISRNIENVQRIIDIWNSRPN